MPPPKPTFERWFKDKERGSFALAENWEVQLNEGSLSCKFVVDPTSLFVVGGVEWVGTKTGRNKLVEVKIGF